ncbi:MAG: hypothetical protein ACTHW4_05930 [Actinomycetales bacterium]
MRSMSRAFALPVAVLLTAALGACSDGPSVSSQTHEPGTSTSVPSDSGPGLTGSASAGPQDEDSESDETPTDGETPSGAGEEPTDDEATTSPDDEGTDDPERPGTDAPSEPTAPEPSPPQASEESPTSPAGETDPPSEQPTTETPSTGDPEEPSEDRTEEPGPPGGDGVRAAAGAARSTYPAADVVSVVHIDDNSTSGPPTDTGFVVVLVAGDERVELTLDASYGVVSETSSAADAATLALVEDDHLTLEDAFGRVVDQGTLDGKIVRSVELVSWEGEISWDFYVFGTSTMVASIDAVTGDYSSDDSEDLDGSGASQD